MDNEREKGLEDYSSPLIFIPNDKNNNGSGEMSENEKLMVQIQETEEV